MRLAWFSPVPPVRSGVAGRSDELVRALRRRGHQIDIYVDDTLADESSRSAHDFPWRHLQQPYDLTVYQFGNSSHHDYAWPYAFRYPGLAVLHETRLHHARAALLLREKRVADYRAEFAFNHPDKNPDLAELAVAGFDSPLYYDWPMVRALVHVSRLVAVHGNEAAADLNERVPGVQDRIVAVRLGEGETLTPEREAEARRGIRAHHGISEDAVLFGCFGGLTPEKRIPQILDALRATVSSAPSARLMLAGAPADHFDIAAEIRTRGLEDRVALTGYLESDADLTDHLAACDVSLNLRWPTARETSGPWLRALAASRPTIVTDLVHMGHVPSMDPRTWRMNFVGTRDPGSEAAVCVSIDILDEDHSLRLAMRRLAMDAELRTRLGQAAREWWQREHSVDVMVDDYLRAMDMATKKTPAPVELPRHLRDDGTARLRALAEPFGVAAALSRDGFLE